MLGAGRSVPDSGGAAAPQIDAKAKSASTDMDSHVAWGAGQPLAQMYSALFLHAPASLTRWVEHRKGCSAGHEPRHLALLLAQLQHGGGGVGKACGEMHLKD